METLYRKVSVSEEKPKSTGFYWIENIVGEMKSSYYDSMLGMFTGDYANFWLKPTENPTAQLKADKEELLEVLEDIRRWTKIKDGKANYTTSPERFQEIESLIQKHRK